MKLQIVNAALVDAVIINASPSGIRLAESLWATTLASFDLAECIASHIRAHEGDLKAAGIDAGIAWAAISGNVAAGRTTRDLASACYETNLTKKEASKFLNAMELVSKVRVGQVLAGVYDGDNSKNSGNKAAAASDDAADDAAAVKTGFTFAQVLASIQSLGKLSEEQASAMLEVISGLLN